MKIAYFGNLLIQLFQVGVHDSASPTDIRGVDHNFYETVDNSLNALIGFLSKKIIEVGRITSSFVDRDGCT